MKSFVASLLGNVFIRHPFWLRPSPGGNGGKIIKSDINVPFSAQYIVYNGEITFARERRTAFLTVGSSCSCKGRTSRDPTLHNRSKMAGTRALRFSQWLRPQTSLG